MTGHKEIDFSNNHIIHEITNENLVEFIKNDWLLLRIIQTIKDLFENNIIRNIRKNKPPIHWEDDLHKIRVGSRYFIFLIVENPLPVKPDTDSKIALRNVTWKLLK